MPSKTDAGAAITRFLNAPNSRTDFLGSFLVCVDLPPASDVVPIGGRTTLFSGMIYGIGPTIAQYWSAAEVGAAAWKANQAVTTTDLENGWTRMVQYCATNSGANIGARSNTLIDFKGAHPNNARNAKLELQFKGPRGATTTRVQPTLTETSRERLDFFNRLSGSDYSVHAATSQQLVKGIEKERQGAGALVNQQDAFGANNYLDLRGYAVRRACKFLLYDTVGVSKEDKGHVHYALDGLNLTDVAGKAHRALDTTTAKVPVCTSELRELFRMWAFFKNDVTFYANFGKVNPPWEISDQQAWAQYALARTQKMAARLNATEISSVADAVASSQWKQAIDAYHAIQPHKVQSKLLPQGI